MLKRIERIDALGWRRLVATTSAVLLSCVVFAQSATAALIADYEFATNFDLSSSVTGVLSSTPGDVSFGAGYAAGAVSTGLGNPARAVFFGSSTATAADLAAAIAADDYATFTITPDAGTPLNLTELRFDSQINFPTSVTTWTLYADPDSGMLGTLIDTGALAAPASPAVFETEAANLTGAALLQNITTARTFRIYFHGYTSGTAAFRIDNIQLDGVVVPEPASLVLMTTLLVGSVMVRRRR